MPRTSRYVIELSADERSELERRAREQTGPWREVQRARMILYAAEAGRTRTSRLASIATPRSSAAGGEGSASSASRASRTSRARAARAVFPPEQVAEVKALACELPATHGLPLGRFSRTELHRLVIERGVTRRLGLDDLALAARRRAAALAAALVDLRARP